ncbi:FkbM family methyltransferase [Mycobacterium tilburgii]|uniref:FkbM family methyltransferase n=1 Tax=Mycobacterium tilburgii TaxID=44467 RepID=UPI0016424B52|nr:FkbM family methyltransferase [Mycobacterium tilburgii]
MLGALDLASDDTPIECDYGSKFVASDSMKNYLLRVRGVYEPVLSEFIVHHIKPGDVCVDAGSNIGYFTMLLAQRVGRGGKVISIEAGPDTVRRLRTNIDLNGVGDIVTVVSAACSDHKGRLTFHVHPKQDGWSRVRPLGAGDPYRDFMGDEWIPVDVPADTLAGLVGDDTSRVSFIKIDIEGEEAVVAPRVPADFPHPDLVVAMEVRAPFEEVLQPFADQGFHVYDLNNDYLWLFERKTRALTVASYDAFDGREQVDVLLSRKPLDLAALNS